MSISPLAAPMTAALRELTRFWWLWLLAGIFWIVVALVVLQFEQASITTVGVLIGVMFLISGLQQFVVGALVRTGWKWLFYVFGVLFLAAGVVSLVRPEDTFAGVADILGFLFLLVGAFWIIEAFAEKDFNELWWLGLISGILMVILAFWTSGQFFISRVYTLLIFAGIWALMHGITDIIRAFEIRALNNVIAPDDERERAKGPAGGPAIAGPGT
jgi:uncharacterized membrane protein HdeD (DUF308 family)